MNNRSITQQNNKNLNSIINFQSEEKYIIDNVDKLLKDQNGCRILQKKLDEKSIEFMTLFYEKIKFNISSIINNQFGNYLMQKFIECSLAVDISFLNNLIDNIKGFLLGHSNDPYGSRVIQKLLDLMITKQIPNSTHIVDTLMEFGKSQMFSLISDTNGNHVFQKIYVLSRKYGVITIFEEVMKHIVEVAKLKQGASVIHKMLEFVGDASKV